MGQRDAVNPIPEQRTARRDRRAELARLARLVQAIECPAGADFLEPGAPEAGPPGRIPTGWPAVVAGLPAGRVHEWFGLAAAGGPCWTPPLCILTHLAWQALAQRGADHDAEGEEERDHGRRQGWAVWIGRRVWPYPRVLLRGPGDDAEDANAPVGAAGPIAARERSLLRRSLFVDPPSAAVRLWAIDLALRCPAVTVVLADGSGLTMAETRRLQLAAEAGASAAQAGSSGVPGEGGLALLARPPAEVGALSAAATRWWVGPARSPTDRPRWTVELLRAKGAGVCGVGRVGPAPAVNEETAAGDARRWVLEWDHVQGVIDVPAGLVDRPGAAEVPIAEIGARAAAATRPRRRADHPRPRRRRRRAGGAVL